MSTRRPPPSPGRSPPPSRGKPPRPGPMPRPSPGSSPRPPPSPGKRPLRLPGRSPPPSPSRRPRPEPMPRPPPGSMPRPRFRPDRRPPQSPSSRPPSAPTHRPPRPLGGAPARRRAAHTSPRGYREGRRGGEDRTSTHADLPLARPMPGLALPTGLFGAYPPGMVPSKRRITQMMRMHLPRRRLRA